MREHKIIKYSAMGLLILFTAFSYYRYHEVNTPAKMYKVHEETLKVGDMIENAGLLISFDKIKVIKEYDADYQSYVYQYKIHVKAKNISNEKFSIQEKIAENLVLVTAGRKWFANPIASDLTMIKQGEKLEEWIQIDVVEEDDIKKKEYEAFQLYYIQREENRADKYVIK